MREIHNMVFNIKKHPWKADLAWGYDAQGEKVIPFLPFPLEMLLAVLDRKKRRWRDPTYKGRVV